MSEENSPVDTGDGMDFRESELMSKVVEHRKQLVQLSGYVTSVTDQNIRLYPRLDPDCYYVIPVDCIIDSKSDASDSERSVLLVEAECAIDIVRVTSAQHRETDPCACGTGKHGQEPDIVYAKKDDLRKMVIRLGRLLVDMGIEELDCTKWTTADAQCCKAWNNLLREVRAGGNLFDAGNRVLAECAGIG